MDAFPGIVYKNKLDAFPGMCLDDVFLTLDKNFLFLRLLFRRDYAMCNSAVRLVDNGSSCVGRAEHSLHRLADSRLSDSDSCSLGEGCRSGCSGLSRITTGSARYITAHHGLDYLHNTLSCKRRGCLCFPEDVFVFLKLVYVGLHEDRPSRKLSQGSHVSL